MGWGTGERRWAKGRALQHNGSNTRNYFTAWVAPKIDLCLAIARNAAGEKVPEVSNRIAEELARQFAG